MAKELYVSSTPHETKVAVVEEDQLSEIYFERENEYTGRLHLQRARDARFAGHAIRFCKYWP